MKDDRKKFKVVVVEILDSEQETLFNGKVRAYTAKGALEKIMREVGNINYYAEVFDKQGNLVKSSSGSPA